MATVRFFENQRDFSNHTAIATTQILPETTILATARSAGLVIESPCNCAGSCGKCKVKLSPDSLSSIRRTADKDILSQLEYEAGIVLACQTEILGDIDVLLMDRQDNKDLQILNHGRKLDVPIESFIRKQYQPDRQQTEIFAGNELLGSEIGNTTTKIYGVVVDIGTTTLVLSLVDLISGNELTTVSVLNPQSLYAQDVLSRIKFASTADGLTTMYTEVIAAINAMLLEAATKTGINTNAIYDVVFSGNTCMLHLATQTDPSSLGKYPYTPVLYGGNSVPAANYQLTIAPFAQLYLPPIISAYVGADITAGILAANLEQLPGVTLFVDIGTNGEMALAVNGQLAATSTAAGPAFEGMNITCGMRAAPGAVEKFKITTAGSIEITTIGNAAVVGICGSGLLDIVSELVAHGLIGKNGKFTTVNLEQPLLADNIIQLDGKPAFRLETNIYLSQKDIRQVQLAKGAVRAGIESLLLTKNIKAAEVDRVYIAGSFGYHLNPESLIHIGLLPEQFRDKVSFLGNTSKTGGEAFLINQTVRQQMADLVKTVEVLELSTIKDFDRLFVKCLEF